MLVNPASFLLKMEPMFDLRYHSLPFLFVVYFYSLSFAMYLLCLRQLSGTFLLPLFSQHHN